MKPLHPTQVSSQPPARRAHGLKLGLMLSLAFLLGLPVACDRGTHPSQIGSIAPDFTVADGTSSVHLASLRGRVVVLNFWATWCPPCVEELPSLLALQQRMPQVDVVAISIDEDDSIYHKFLIDHNVTLRTVRDTAQSSNALYGTYKLPETYVIDRKGILRRKFIGAQQWTSPEILDYLAKL